MQTIATIATLLLLLASLLVVNRARKEAQGERESARVEIESMREDARAQLADAQRREERVALTERRVAEDQRNAQAYARGLEERAMVVSREEKRLANEHERLTVEHSERLAEIADLSPSEARKELIARMRASAESEVAQEAHRRIKRARSEAEREAQQILLSAMQKQAAATSAQGAVTRIELPSEEMKGRIIGREGRNIRAFEALTGVNVIVDEGVDAVQLSSFDVERREVAEVTLRALIDDGRIQPQRVEAAYAKALADAPRRSMNAALDAVEEAGVSGVPHSILELVGALRLRTSYNQNVLAHLVESANLAAAIAQMVGANVELARRAAFLHDIGKAMTGHHEGTHALLGARAAHEAGEAPDVVNAIEAHHDEVPQQTIEAVIVQVADAVSASRPGARRDDVDSYVERMESLEKLVAEHEGVAHVYAMASGRELRVAVEPSVVDDDGATQLARTIAEHIERDFSFAGEIKVTVIRETRADFVAGQA
ncbi:Rnase Y domain-containing protein [Demequina sp.]|uniref:Rnase Y domain-containing protein n=1 Tax=Demequina sp. TaxID=2050685 RepID=UPI0025BB6F26|nr:Rnase Y domain-containing protein [Demequina sp.]